MERAVGELLAMLQTAAQEVAPDAPWDEEAAEGFRRHHSHLMYKACIAACRSPIRLDGMQVLTCFGDTLRQRLRRCPSDCEKRALIGQRCVHRHYWLRPRAASNP